MIDLTPIFQALIALMAALVTYKLIPWIREKTTATQQANIRAAVKVMVFAAEQLYGAGNGKKKLQYVRDRLREQGFNVDTDEIEATVKEYLNNGMTLPCTEEPENDDDEPDGYMEVPPLDEWPLEMIEDFCDMNDIPCEGCESKEDYIRAITQAGKTEPPEEAAVETEEEMIAEEAETEESENAVGTEE